MHTVSRLIDTYRGSSAYLVCEAASICRESVVLAINSYASSWLDNDPLLPLSGFLLGELRGDRFEGGTYPKAYARPRFREARARRRLGSGRPGRQIFREASLLQAGGSAAHRASVITLLDHWQIFSELFSPLLRPSPTTKPNTSPVSLSSTLSLHQKKRPVSLFVAILTFYTILCIVEYLSLIRSRCSPRACPEL